MINKRSFLVLLTMCLLSFTGQSAAQPSVTSQSGGDGTTEGTSPAATTLLVSLETNPLVVDTGINENITLIAHTDGSIDSASVSLANGTTVPMTKLGIGLFSVVLTHQQVLYHYNQTLYPNVNRYGFINLFIGSFRVLRGRLDIGVDDGKFPSAAISSLASDAQATPHLVNIVRSFVDPSKIDQQAVTKRFYQLYGDDYDFINIISVPEHFSNRYHYQVKNTVSGIGLSKFDNTADYGSAGKLKGITRFPIPVLYFDGASRAHSHETAHQWLQFLNNVTKLQGITPHWPISELARSVMGYSSTGGQGLDFPWNLTPKGNGDYTAHYTPLADDYFQNMDLYLMGFAAPSEVGNYVVFTNQNQTLCDGCTITKPTVSVGVQDVTAQYGARTPGYPNTQHHFRIATIIVSKQLLSARNMEYFDYFSRRGEAMIPIQGNIPWFNATKQRSTLSMGLGNDCNTNTTADLWIYSHTTSPVVPQVNTQFTIYASVNNASANTSHQLTIFNTLSNGLTFISAKLNGSTSRCYGDKTIICTFDTLHASENLTLAITVRAATKGYYFHRIGVSGCNPDQTPTDNAATLTIPVGIQFNNKIYIPFVIKSQ